MTWRLYDYLDGEGRNDIEGWTVGLQKHERGKLNAKLDMLHNHGPGLFPDILSGPLKGYAHIYKIKINGRIAIRPLLSKGPFDNENEYTLLKGALEVGNKWQPPPRRKTPLIEELQSRETRKGGAHMSELDSPLREDFIFNKDEKDYRHGYAEESLDISIGTQIKVLREQRVWRQEDLAREAGMKQPMVSRYESVNYSSWSINTLKKLARAYDVWLDIRFRSFGDLVTTTENFSRKSLQVPKFADDPFFKVRRRVLRPRISTTAQIQNTVRVISFDTQQPITVRDAVAGSIQLSLWDLPSGSGLGPQLVNSQPRPQGTVSAVDLSMKVAAAAGAGGYYGRS